jgi:hypothetical protein
LSSVACAFVIRPSATGLVDLLLLSGHDRLDETVDALALILRDLRERPILEGLAEVSLAHPEVRSRRLEEPESVVRAEAVVEPEARHRRRPKSPPKRNGYSAESIRSFSSFPCSSVSLPASTASSMRFLSACFSAPDSSCRLHAQLRCRVVDDCLALVVR